MNALVKFFRQTLKMAIHPLEKLDAMLVRKFQTQIPIVNNARIYKDNLIGGRIVIFRGGNYESSEVTNRIMSFGISPCTFIQNSAGAPVLSLCGGNYTREGTSLRMFRNRCCSIYGINSSGTDLLAIRDGENCISSEATSCRTFHSTIPSMHVYSISGTEVLIVMYGSITENRQDTEHNVSVEGERQEAEYLAVVTRQDMGIKADAGDDQIRSDYRDPGERRDVGNYQNHRDDWDPEDGRYLRDNLDPVYDRSCRDDGGPEIYQCQKTDRHPVNAVMIGKKTFRNPGADVQRNL